MKSPWRDDAPPTNWKRIWSIALIFTAIGFAIIALVIFFAYRR